MKRKNHTDSYQRLVALFTQTHNELRQQAARAVELSLVIRNWLFGWYIVEFEQDGKEIRTALYGKELINRLSSDLAKMGLKGVSPTNLRKFREFYHTYSNVQQALPGTTQGEGSSKKIQQTLSVKSLTNIVQNTGLLNSVSTTLGHQFKLGWSHYVFLTSLKDKNERLFYETESITSNWSLRELKRQFNTSLYERLLLSRNKKPLLQKAKKNKIPPAPQSIIKDPYVLEFLGLDENSKYSESELETAIINQLEQFLLELGKGFLFEARQKRFTFDEDHYFVDLVFYNRLLRCYVLIDLKIGAITHQDLGQMQMYVNYFDRHVKLDTENPTVGIILCKKNKSALVEITLPRDTNIHASEYRLYLPSKKELKQQVKQAEIEFEKQAG